MNHSFEHLTDEELSKAFEQIGNEIQRRKDSGRVKKAVENINRYGHSELYYPDLPDLKGFKKMIVPVKVRVWTKDREGESDIHFGGFADDQDLPDTLCYWDQIDTALLKKKKDWLVPRDNWDGSDDPLRGTTTIDCYLYYRQAPCPPEGSEIMIYDGTMKEVEIVDQGIVYNGDDLGDWDDYDCLIIEDV